MLQGKLTKMFKGFRLFYWQRRQQKVVIQTMALFWWNVLLERSCDEDLLKHMLILHAYYLNRFQYDIRTLCDNHSINSTSTVHNFNSYEIKFHAFSDIIYVTKQWMNVVYYSHEQTIMCHSLIWFCIMQINPVLSCHCGCHASRVCHNSLR